MEALIPLVALISLGLLAVRFGADSRPTIRSEEDRLAATGMTWNAVSSHSNPSALEPRHEPEVTHLVWTPAPAASPASPFPTLRALDRARDPGQISFATDADAAFLERRARQLIDNHWSERVWLTGFIDRARFDRLCDTLERDRQLLQGQRVDEAVLVYRPSSLAR